jgi:hypothetical protein
MMSKPFVRSYRQVRRWQGLLVGISILVIILGCQATQPAVVASTPTLLPPIAIPPTETTVPPTAIPPTPFVAGECDPTSERIDMDMSYSKHITGGSYPETCPMYCLWTPPGSQLLIKVSDFSINLDFYVDQNLSVADYSDFGQWYAHSTAETGSEEVTISDPDGRFYIQVCAYSPYTSDETDFNLSTTFTP